jgi:hypothetical protein
MRVVVASKEPAADVSNRLTAEVLLKEKQLVDAPPELEVRETLPRKEKKTKERKGPSMSIVRQVDSSCQRALSKTRLRSILLTLKLRTFKKKELVKGKRRDLKDKEVELKGVGRLKRAKKKILIPRHRLATRRSLATMK